MRRDSEPREVSAFERASRLSPITIDGEERGGVLQQRTSPIRIGTGEIVASLAKRLQEAAEGEDKS